MPKINEDHKIQFGNTIYHTAIPQFVKSWRWLVLDEETLLSLRTQNKIISSKESGTLSTAILTDSEHFDKTLIVTLFAGSPTNTMKLIHTNHGAEKNYPKNTNLN